MEVNIKSTLISSYWLILVFSVQIINFIMKSFFTFAVQREDLNSKLEGREEIRDTEAKERSLISKIGARVLVSLIKKTCSSQSSSNSVQYLIEDRMKNKRTKRWWDRRWNCSRMSYLDDNWAHTFSIFSYILGVEI